MDTHPQDMGQVRGAVREWQDLERPAGIGQDPGQVRTGEALSASASAQKGPCRLLRSPVAAVLLILAL